MTRSIRALLGLAAVAVAASAAGAQPPQDSTQSRSDRAAATAGSSKTQSKGTKAVRRYRNVSKGEVLRAGPHAVARDYYGADDPRCDDLCQREKMMDAKYGKNRERRPGGA